MGGVNHQGGRYRTVVSMALAALILTALFTAGCKFVTRNDDCVCAEIPPCVCDPDEICPPCCDDPPPPDWTAMVTGDWVLWDWLEGDDNVKAFITFGADGEMYRVDYQKVDDVWFGTSERWWSWRVAGDSLILSRVDDGYERDLRMSFTVTSDTLVTTVCYSAYECYEDGFNRSDIAAFRNDAGTIYSGDPALYTTYWRMASGDGVDETLEFYGPRAYLDQDPPRYFSSEDYVYVWYTDESNLFLIGTVPSDCKVGVDRDGGEYEHDCVLSSSEAAMFGYAAVPRESLTLRNEERGIDDVWHFDAEYYSAPPLSKRNKNAVLGPWYGDIGGRLGGNHRKN